VSLATDALDSFEQHETFRNELASVAPDGRRRWIYARQPAGRFYRARTLVSVCLLAFLFAAPFVRFNGLPLVLLNVIERRFVLFGVIFWPQDFYLVVLIAIAVLVTLVLSTATIGRVWCGWLCPQTVFMEMVFRKIEFLIEGSAAQQMRRDRGPWHVDRVWRTGLKHAVFFGLSFAIANVFLAYIIGAEALRAIVTAPPREHLVGLTAITLFSGVFYAVFARFREQACVLACPYGRVMSSLIDRHTITVTYDTGRGEPRGRLVRGTAVRAGAEADTDARRGDCVDCFQCVTVCPTGIDIRNGVQLECVNCTACMDACDDVMQRLQRRRGLIRLTSHEAVSRGSHADRRRRLWWHWLTPRIAAYATVWLVLVFSVSGLVAARPDLDILILRQAGTLFGTENNGAIVNLYTVQVFNRAAATRNLAIAVRSPEDATVTLLGPLTRVSPYALQEGRVLVSVPKRKLSGPVTPLRFEVRADGGPARTIESSLVGPGGLSQAREESR
jgi:cytochrome c oxidase accessory protein FixG